MTHHGAPSPFSAPPPSSASALVPATSLALLRPARTVALVAAVAVVSGGVGGVVGAAAAPGPAAAPSAPAGEVIRTRAADGAVSDVAAKVLPSVVSVEVRSSDASGSGSGVVLDRDGHVLTNDHVVAPGVDGAVAVVLSDGRRVDAEIVGRDPVTDLAVLDVDGVDDLQPVEPGRSSDVEVGDPVVAVGSPLGLSGTVTTGIISALGRTVRTSPQTPLLGALQTDAAINPGNSGGALVDADGRLIGINTAISTRGGGSIGLGFAIPADEARSVADELIRTGRATHPSLGVGATPVTDEDGRSGARLADVPAGSAAARGGLREGDVVVAVEGEAVSDVDALVLALRQREVGEPTAVTYLRDGREQTTSVVLVDRRV